MRPRKYLDSQQRCAGDTMKIKEMGEDYCIFENGDGTCYTMQYFYDLYGGLNVLVNSTSCWRVFSDSDIKHLCGDDNPYTRQAILDLYPLI